MAIMETESVIGLREEKNVNFGWRDMKSLLGQMSFNLALQASGTSKCT